ncbi:MAG: hypothetical protein ACYC96_00055 [Fimbriimonadaceae bacterium]
MRKLLIGHPGASWRSWLSEHVGANDYLCLDPADSHQPRPAQLTLFRGSATREWRFYGSLEAGRAPHLLITGALRLLRSAAPDVVIQAPAYRPSPLARQTALLLAEASRPDEILIADGTELSYEGFTVGPEPVPTDVGFPALVSAAQRKARWMGFLDNATLQDIQLDRVSIEGARLGSGRRLSLRDLDRHLPTAAYAELTGSTLFVVTTAPLDDAEAARALDACHANRLHTVAQSAYENLVCSLARGSGDDFAFGIIRNIDFRRGSISLVSDAIPPAPATILRLGSLRVDAKGNECGETRPWAL